MVLATVFSQADLISEEEFKAAQKAATRSVSESKIGDESEAHTRVQWWVVALVVAVLSILAFFFKDFLF